MAYRGYNGSLPPKLELSLTSLWSLLRRKYPEELHIRIKRYSMEDADPMHCPRFDFPLNPNLMDRILGLACIHHFQVYIQ